MKQHTTNDLVSTKKKEDAEENIICNNSGNVSEKHCITCSDEAISARVLRIDQLCGVALVVVGDVEEEVDITLLEQVQIGDEVLVHGGVAISCLNEVHDE